MNCQLIGGEKAFPLAQDLAANRAVVMVIPLVMPYLYKRSRLLPRSSLQLAKEMAYSL